MQCNETIYYHIKVYSIPTIKFIFTIRKLLLKFIDSMAKEEDLEIKLKDNKSKCWLSYKVHYYIDCGKEYNVT